MKTLVFFLEGPSEKEMLMGLLPRLLPADVAVRYLVFQGKQDLEKSLVRRLRGWQLPESVFIVLRDQDAADCHEVKNRLRQLCDEAGRTDTLVRIACRELESFYLGDLAAVGQGLGLNRLKDKQAGRKFRHPDALVHPAMELIRLTGKRYDKISGSRAIAPHLQIDCNKSHSFNVLVAGIRKLTEAF